MMVYFEKYWLDYLVGLVLAGYMLYGHYRGFIKTAVSMTMMILTLYIVNMSLPYTTGFLKENTTIRERIQTGVLDGLSLEPIYEEEALTANSQQAQIESLELPDSIKKLLSNNNHSKAWEILGVDRFADYVSGYLSNMIFNILCFVITFVVIWLVLYIVFKILNVFSKLPVIHGINQILGALLGLCQGLIYVWIAFLVIVAFSGTAWGGQLLERINASAFLGVVFRLNILSRFLNVVF